jgi:glycosyltransferase involved in cell wall biosynthesis
MSRAIGGSWSTRIHGLVAVEAMVRGVPAIVTDHGGGLAETVERGVSGLHVLPEDVPALRRWRRW